MSRLRTLVLLAIFLLVSADPTPRFLGMRRLPTRPLPSLLGAQKVRTVLESYSLPAAIAARASADTHAASVAVLLAPAPGAPLAPPTELACLAASPAVPSSQRSRSTRGGPPLRC